MTIRKIRTKSCRAFYIHRMIYTPAGFFEEVAAIDYAQKYSIPIECARLLVDADEIYTEEFKDPKC